MKKYLALLLVMAMTAAPAALAEAPASDGATPLPYGVNFDMDGATVAATIGGDAVFPEEDEYNFDPETGYVVLEECDLGVAGLRADTLSFEISRNNSQSAPKLYHISASGLPTGDNCVKAFREAVDALREVYGVPDNDPFDAEAVESYKEFGNLIATWTFTDARITLMMQRMYGEYMTLDFTNRLCYDEADLLAE